MARPPQSLTGMLLVSHPQLRDDHFRETVVRQVSFTLLLTQSRRNGNPAQYERNRRFRHLV